VFLTKTAEGQFMGGLVLSWCQPAGNIRANLIGSGPADRKIHFLPTTHTIVVGGRTAVSVRMSDSAEV
jgi:hypothetical protein